MIYAFNMTCARDLELRNLMLSTYEKHSGFTSWLSKDSAYLKDYGNGAGWSPSMMKLDLLRELLDKFPVQDNDFVLSVDSDVVFTSPEVFKYANPEYGIIGILGQQPWNTIYGKWAHLSGCLIFIRGDIAKKMCQFTEEELHNIRYNEFKTCDITENEDVVLSYLAMKCGANVFDLLKVPDLTSGDFEGDASRKFVSEPCNNVLCSCQYELGKGFRCAAIHLTRKSFYHLNYCPTQFLGEPVSGKWMIPSILQMKGIEL